MAGRRIHQRAQVRERRGGGDDDGAERERRDAGGGEKDGDELAVKRERET